MKRIIKQFKTGEVVPESAIYLSSVKRTETEHAYGGYVKCFEVYHYFLVFEEEKEKIVIELSGRIDYCCECGKEHGYDCPLDKSTNDINVATKIFIDGEEYELYEMSDGTFSTRRDGYVGQYKLIAKKGDEEFPIHSI